MDKTAGVVVFLGFCRDLSVDAGLPPHQFHIHPLPQHYQHYLTSPRMHHFPRNNASTQVVRPFSASDQWSARLHWPPGDLGLGSNFIGGGRFLVRYHRRAESSSSSVLQVVHEIRNYPYPQLHLLALQSLNPSRHASAVRESYEVCVSPCPLSPHTPQAAFIRLYFLCDRCSDASVAPSASNWGGICFHLKVQMSPECVSFVPRL